MTIPILMLLFAQQKYSTRFSVYGLFILLFSLVLFSCSTKSKLTRVEQSNTRFEKGSVEDSAITAMIDPYKTPLEKEMQKVLIVSEQEIVKNLPEGLLGNCVTDIVLTKSIELYKNKVDMCMLNNGGLRASLPKGEITLGKIFELMPFENELVVVTLSGKKTKELFDYIAVNKGMPIAGAKLGIKDSVAVNVLVGGIAFDENKEYKVVTSDYLASGGDKMKFFKNPVKYEIIGKKIRDAIIDYISEEGAKGNTLKIKLDGRVYIEK